MTQDRPGAQHDVEALGGLCQTLGFETTLRTDPTAQVRGSPEPLEVLQRKGTLQPDPGDSLLGLLPIVGRKCTPILPVACTHRCEPTSLPLEVQSPGPLPPPTLAPAQGSSWTLRFFLGGSLVPSQAAVGSLLSPHGP